MALISGAASGGGGSLDGWTQTGETLTYASATTFTVAGDATAKYTTGTRIKLTQTTVKYFVVVSSSFAVATTTVAVTGGTDYTLANAAITQPFYSYQANPQGYPSWFTYTTTAAGFSATTDLTGYFSVVGRMCTVQIYVSGTSNATTFTITLPIVSANAVNYIPPSGVVNNSVALTTPGRIDIASGVTTVSVFRDMAGAAWTGSGTKSLQGQFFYRV